MSINALSTPKIGFGSVYQKISGNEWQEIGERISNEDMKNIIKKSYGAIITDNPCTGRTFIATDKDTSVVNLKDKFFPIKTDTRYNLTINSKDLCLRELNS